MRSLIRAGIRQYSAWTSMSLTGRILAAAVGVGAASIIVKGISFFKEIVVAFYFGTDRSLDIFFIALALPTFGISVLGNAIQPAFIPIYLDVLHKEGPTASRALSGSIFIIYTALLIVVSTLMVLSSQWLLKGLASGFSETELLRARHLFYVVMPVLVFTGCAKLYTALLAAEHRFVFPTLLSAATPLCTMGLLLIMHKAWGVYSLAIAASLGALIELVMLGWHVVHARVTPNFKWGGVTSEVRQVFMQLLPLIAGSVLMAGTAVTDQAMATMLPAGAVSALNYGNKLPAVTIVLISGALGTAVLPYFSRMTAAGDWRGVNEIYTRFIRLVLYATLPLTGLLIASSHLIVKTVFEHGAFSASAGQTVSNVQICLLLEIPFYTVSILAVRMITALKKTVVLAWGAAISLVLNIALNYILMRIFGIAGIALATSLVYLVSMLYLLYMSKRYINFELNA